MNNKFIILLRHGQSLWNLENRFTGWTDVDLTSKGCEEAHQAGTMIAQAGYLPEVYFTSYLRRAITTLNLSAESMNREWIEVIKDWRLNERHYGALEGLNKAETAIKYGEEQVKIWRRSYDVEPPQVSESDPRFPGNSTQYRDIPSSLLPHGESLKDTIERVKPCWDEIIIPKLNNVHCILISAHGNSLRGIAMMLLKLTPDEIVNVEIPNGKPWVFKTDNQLNIINHFYL